MSNVKPLGVFSAVDCDEAVSTGDMLTSPKNLFRKPVSCVVKPSKFWRV
jgi:hypothetical protein